MVVFSTLEALAHVGARPGRGVRFTTADGSEVKAFFY